MSWQEGIAGVLEEHEAVGWMLDSRGEQAWTCGCGNGVELPPEHHAHVAAAVVAWLWENAQDAGCYCHACKTIRGATEDQL